MLQSELSQNAKTTTLPKNQTVHIKKKYKDKYLVAHPSLSQEMWIDEKQIIPLYLFTTAENKEEWDLFFNTHTRIRVHNLSWSNPPKYKPLTAFYLQLQNTAPHFVQNIELAITLQDPKTLQEKTTSIQITGTIAPANSVSVGTLWNPISKTFQYTTEEHYKEMLKREEIQNLQWSPSINLDVEALFSDIVVQAVFAEIQH